MLVSVAVGVAFAVGDGLGRRQSLVMIPAKVCADGGAQAPAASLLRTASKPTLHSPRLNTVMPIGVIAWRIAPDATLRMHGIG